MSAILNFDFDLSVMHVGEKNELSNKGLLMLLQEAATKASSVSGYCPNTAIQTGMAWILLNWKIKIFSRPIWNSKITVKTWPRSFIRCYSCRDFELYDENNNLIAIASSKWILFSLTTGRITKITEEMIKKYNFLDKSVFEEDFEKLEEKEDSFNTFNYVIQKRDIDTNHHVNNTNYIDFALETLPKEAYNIDFNNMEILYKHEVKIGDTISCSYFKEENGTYVVTIKKEDAIATIVKLF